MPAMQEFLASFAVDIDFGGVDRLQKILSENRDLANRLAAAFLSARSELSALFAESSRSLLSLPPVSVTSDRNGAGRREDELSSSLSEIASLLSRLIQSRRGENDNGSGAPAPAVRRSAAETNPNDTVSRTSSAALPDLSLSALLDLSEASESLQAFEAEAQKPLSLSGDASGITIAAENALTRLRSRFASETLRLNAVISWSEEDNPSPSGSLGASGTSGSADIQTTSGNSGSTGLPGASPSSGSPAEASSPKQTRPVLQSSTGGRFSKRVTTEVAEDGDPEYIIPVKKENLAVPLLRQLFSELSASARASLSDELSTTNGVILSETKDPFYNTSPDLGSLSPALSALISLPSLLSSASVLFSSVSSAPAASAPAPAAANVNQSVQAPVTIQVTSTEASAEAIGRTVYDTAERTLLRTLKGVFV